MNIIILRNAIEEAEIKKNVDEYLHLLTNAISEKEFITDYVQFYPVETDLNILSNMCPEVYPFINTTWLST